jgi:hypothetical protein
VSAAVVVRGDSLTCRRDSDKITLKTKGFGFVSFGDAKDFVAAMKEMVMRMWLLSAC